MPRPSFDTANMSSSVPAVKLAGVTKSFRDVDAVRGLDLRIEPGEVVALLGPNGAGKTTTVDMLLGLSTPSAGLVELFGGTPRQAVALGRVAAVMQTGGLIKDFTVRETVVFTASLFRPVRPVDEVLARAGILDIADRPVGKASGGQQQRLRFAMALLSDPDLLILDEPTTGMDVQGRRDFWASIRQDADRGRTTIFATHYLEEADAYADRIVLMRRGRIVADGSAAQIKALSVGRTVRATWPDVDPQRLALVHGVEDIEVHGDRVVIHGSDSDAIARFLLQETTASDLEISSRNLQDAFVALTADEEGVPA